MRASVTSGTIPTAKVGVAAVLSNFLHSLLNEAVLFGLGSFSKIIIRRPLFIICEFSLLKLIS